MIFARRREAISTHPVEVQRAVAFVAAASAVGGTPAVASSDSPVASCEEEASAGGLAYRESTTFHVKSLIRFCCVTMCIYYQQQPSTLFNYFAMKI